MLNRRDLVRKAALAAAGAAFVADALPGASAKTPAPPGKPLSWTPTALTIGEARIVEVVCQLVIPASASPGAMEAGVPQFIDRTMANYFEAATADDIRAGLARLNADCLAQHRTAFIAAAPAAQIEIMRRCDIEASAAFLEDRLRPHFFVVLKEFTVIGYFTSKPGATLALRYDPIPGDYHGDLPLKQIGRAWAT